MNEVAIPCYEVTPTASLIVGELDVDDKAALLLLQQATLYSSLLAVLITDTLKLHVMVNKDPDHVFHCQLCPSLLGIAPSNTERSNWVLHLACRILHNT